MKIQKNAAVALFVALGLKNADKWNEARLSAKLGKIKEMVDEDVKLDGAEQELLTGVMAAAAAGEEFEIEGGEPAVAGDQSAEIKAPAATKQTDEEKAAKAAAKEAEKAKKDAEKAAAKEAKAAERAAAKAAKAAAKEPHLTKAFLAGQVVAKAGGVENFKRELIQRLYGEGYSKAIVDVTFYRTLGGIRGFLAVPETRPGRLYLAGKLLKEDGLEVTDAMVKKLDEIYGKPNEKESKTALTHTRDVIKGFQSVEVVAAPPAPAA
jgi:hypothetical protein